MHICTILLEKSKTFVCMKPRDLVQSQDGRGDNNSPV